MSEEMGAKLFVSAVGVPPKFVVDKLHAAGIPAACIDCYSEYLFESVS